MMLADVAGLNLLWMWVVCQSILVDNVLADVARLYVCWPLWPNGWLWPTLVRMLFDLYLVFVCLLCFDVLCIE